MTNEMRDRLVELIKQARQRTKNANCDIERNMLFADHLIENGVIVLLCKVGDRVYQTDGTKIYELEVLDVSVHKNMPYYETESIDFDTRAIGTSIFLTKEEAEQKLKEMRGGTDGNV